MERLTITRTRRWGNSEIQINNVYSAPRSKVKMDQVISMANDMISREDVITNEEIEYEVLCSRDNGSTEFIHRVEKKGKRRNPMMRRKERVATTKGRVTSAKGKGASRTCLDSGGRLRPRGSKSQSIKKCRKKRAVAARLALPSPPTIPPPLGQRLGR